MGKKTDSTTEMKRPCSFFQMLPFKSKVYTFQLLLYWQHGDFSPQSRLQLHNWHCNISPFLIPPFQSTDFSEWLCSLLTTDWTQDSVFHRSLSRCKNVPSCNPFRAMEIMAFTSPKSIAYVHVWCSTSGTCGGKFSPIRNTEFARGDPTLLCHRATQTWSWLSQYLLKNI